MHRPATLEELIERARRLEGVRLGDLARQARIALPDGAAGKGKPGAVLEALLGATGGSRAEHDFPELAVELKSLPVDPAGQPYESTYVCRIRAEDADAADWATSWARRKLSCVLFVPIVARDRREPVADRIVADAFPYRPTAEDDATLRADFEDIMGAIALGGIETLTAHVGQVMQSRPKAADGGVRTTLHGPDGELIQTVPRGFYLRPQFTAGLLRRARAARAPG